jgi:hypothetical protein
MSATERSGGGVTKALPLEELLSFSTGEMLAFKRRGWLPSLAETIAEAILEGDPGPRYSGGRRRMQNCFGAVFYGSGPPTEFEALVETITRILGATGVPRAVTRLKRS